MPDNGPRTTFRCPAKKSVTVVDVCQEQRRHQCMRGLHGEQPTDRPELPVVEVTVLSVSVSP